MTDTRHAIEDSTPGSAEANDHEQNLTILKWEASERGFADSSPGADAATAVTLPSGLQVSASAAHLRYLVEEEIRRRGTPSGLISEVRAAVRDAEGVGVEVTEEGASNPETEIGQWERAEELQQILSVLESQAALVLERNKAFETQFKKHAYRTAWTILEESRRRVKVEMGNYGMTVDRETSHARSAAVPDTEAMRVEATRLANSRRGVDELAEKRQELLESFRYVDVMNAMPRSGAQPRTENEQQALAVMDVEVEAAVLAHVQLRVEVEGSHPALARYESADALERIASNRSGHDVMAWDLDENLINIDKTQNALASGELDPLKLPQIVEMSEQVLMVPSGSMRSMLVNDLVSKANEWEFRAIAITAIAIGLGLLSIPLSGGASAGVAVAGLAVEGVGAALEMSLVSESISDYQIKKAAHGTDPDKLRVLVQEEPSLGWLAVEILGAAVGLGAAMQAFRGIRAARLAALKSKSALELEQQLGELRQLGEGAGLSEKSQRRLIGEVQERRAATDASVGEAELTTVDTFAVGVVPTGDPWTYLANPGAWTPERRALHDRLIKRALEQAKAFDDAVGGDPTLFAMRGNTASGKTRAIKGNIPELEGATEATKELPHRSVNPDNFKVDLMAESDIPLTSSQVHLESSVLASRLTRELAAMRRVNGEAASMLVDKRLGSMRDVDELEAMAVSSGRKLHIYDVDAPLEFSLAGVLGRKPGGKDPIPPFSAVADGGFGPARANRQEVLDRFMENPELGKYELYATMPSGEKKLVVRVDGGLVNIHDRALLASLTEDPVKKIEEIRNARITKDFIEEFTAPLDDGFAAQVRATLEEYVGYTWEEAVARHSARTR